MKLLVVAASVSVAGAVPSGDVCTASAAFLPSVCPGYSPCNPNSIRVGDEVTIEVCIENNSEMFSKEDAYSTTAVDAVLPAGSEIEVWLSCTSSRCTQQFDGVLSYSLFTPHEDVDASFLLGATRNCPDPSSCGSITLGTELKLHDTKLCLGTIHQRAVNLPVGSRNGLFV